MSTPATTATGLAAEAPAPAMQRIEIAAATLGEGLEIRRALPTRQRRMVGPWCFLDLIGPADVSAGGGVRVGPHPHIGLQTVTWLYEGELLHRDSLGSEQLIRPGQLNLMTSGRGISHSEESPAQRPAGMHGLQFWIALPDEAREIEPAFVHHPAVPQLQLDGGLEASVLVGTALGATSPARMYAPVMGLDLRLPGAGRWSLPLEPAFEHAALVTAGTVTVENEDLAVGTLLYLGGRRDLLRLQADGAARLAVIGGQAFAEPVRMWWNFVARSKAELSAASRAWNAGDAVFGTVRGYAGARLEAPLPPWAE